MTTKYRNRTALRDRRIAVRAELEQLHNGALADGDRRLNAGEQDRFERGVAEIEGIDRELDRFDELERLASNPGNIERGDAPGLMTRVDPFGDDSPVVDRARALIDSDRAGDILADTQQEALDRLVRTRDGNVDGARIAQRLLLTERPEYRSAFQRMLAEPLPLLTAEEVQAVRDVQAFERAMSEGTTTAGGFGVPVMIDPTIVMTAQGSPNDFFAISRVETITTNVWKGVNSAGVSWSFDNEAAEVSDDSPTLDQPVVQAYMARGFVPYSIEVSQDYVGFATEISRLLAAGYSELLVSKFTNGTGSGEPKGIVVALDATTSAEVVVVTDGAFGAVDVYATWAALPNRFKANARWMSSTDVQNKVRQFGTDSAAHQFTINLTQERETALFGHPYHLNDFMPTFTGTTGARNILIVGDFSHFLIAQRAGMTVELVPHLFGTGSQRPTGQRGLFAFARVGSDVTTPLAFRLTQNQ